MALAGVVYQTNYSPKETAETKEKNENGVEAIISDAFF